MQSRSDYRSLLSASSERCCGRRRAAHCGLLYNTSEAHSLVYECEKQKDGSLNCSFVQTAVRRNAEPSGLAAALQKAKDEYPSVAKNLEKAECEQADTILTALEKGVPPPGADVIKFAENTAKLAPAQRADIVKMFSLLRDFCKAPSEKNYLKTIEHQFLTETRTCKVFAELV